MKLTLTNNGPHAVPVMSTDGDGFVESLDPGEAYAMDDPDDQVIVIGNKPSVTEQIQTAFERLKDTVVALVTAWQDNNQKVTTEQAQVRVEIQNDGDKPVRVILGDGKTDAQVQPGNNYVAVAWGYVELRELGNVAQDPNQHEAS